MIVCPVGHIGVGLLEHCDVHLDKDNGRMLAGGVAGTTEDLGALGFVEDAVALGNRRLVPGLVAAGTRSLLSACPLCASVVRLPLTNLGPSTVPGGSCFRG
jgi:hypothetical protein